MSHKSVTDKKTLGSRGARLARAEVTKLHSVTLEVMYAIKCKANECSRYMGICVLVLEKSVHVVTEV